MVILAGSVLLSTALLLLAGAIAWRWTDAHLPHLGLTTAEAQPVNRTELVRQIHAFQLITVRQTYAAHTEQSLSQTFNVGASQVALPDWLAGERMTVQGQAQVLAGVDLAQVRAADIAVKGSAKTRSVQVTLPPAQVLSAELVPNTLHVSTSAGALPQLEWALGISNDQLRDRSVDLLLQTGRQAAQERGIEASASAEAQSRLAGFLQTLPSSGGRVTYTVVVKPLPPVLPG